MLKNKKVPERFWGEAILTVVYLLNRAPTQSVEAKTPYEAWYRRKRKVHHLRVFGCVTHIKVAIPYLKKHEDKSITVVFIGYDPSSKAY